MKIHVRLVDYFTFTRSWAVEEFFRVIRIFPILYLKLD